MKVKIIHGHGNHLIVDGYSNAKIGSREFIKYFLINLTEKIKMKPISEPLVLYYKAEDNLESGVTGVIILAESSITMHTYPNKKLFFLDIFSCNEFDIDSTLNFLIDELKIDNYKKKILKREL